MNTKLSVTLRANTLVMRMVTATVKSMLIRLKASGHSFALGCGPTVAYPRKNFQSISASSSSYIMLAKGEKHYLVLS